MPRILFTSPCGPYAKVPVDKDPIDYFYYRNTLRQKMFQMRSFQSWHSLHFMAQNLPVPSVVLENPSMYRFKKEVNTGTYDIVAIGFTILLTANVTEMAQWLRQNHPKIEIVVGGYGTAIFKESFPAAEQLKNLVDHICYGEGVSFLKTLLANKYSIALEEKAFRQDLLPARNSFFRTRTQLFEQIVLVGGLGCVYGCSFCATSSQFNRRYIELFSGRQLFECLLEQHKKHPHIQSAVIYEEDFLLNRPRVLEFIEDYKKSILTEKKLMLTVFSSIRTLARYSIEELIECGIGTVFIGVESMSEDVLYQEGLAKRKGSAEEMVALLHSHGINTLGSLVIGWDSQDYATALADVERFVKLNPTFYQVVPLHAVPGTQLWEKMKKDGRILKEYNAAADGINEFNFETRNFSTSEGRKLVFKTYDKLVEEGGPWPFRMFENLISGYRNLLNHPSPTLRNRAIIYKTMIFPVCLIAFASAYFFHGSGFRKRWLTTMKQFAGLFPGYFTLSLLLSPLVALTLTLIYISANFVYTLSPFGDQPDYIRREYKV